MSSTQYFDRVASQWEEMRAAFYSEAVREKAISLARVDPGKVVAGIGAGSGFVTERLISEGLRVIAVDQSEAMPSRLPLTSPPSLASPGAGVEDQPQARIDV